MNLNMEPYCFNYKSVSLDYELQSMCIHNGSLGGGHYYAFCKNLLETMSFNNSIFLVKISLQSKIK